MYQFDEITLETLLTLLKEIAPYATCNMCDDNKAITEYKRKGYDEKYASGYAFGVYYSQLQYVFNTLSYLIGRSNFTTRLELDGEYSGIYYDFTTREFKCDCTKIGRTNLIALHEECKKAEKAKCQST